MTKYLQNIMILIGTGKEHEKRTKPLGLFRPFLVLFFYFIPSSVYKVTPSLKIEISS